MLGMGERMKIKDIIYRDIDEVPLAEYVEAFSFLTPRVDDKNIQTDVDAQNAKSKYLIAYECYRILISLLVVFLVIFANVIISGNVQLDYERIMRGNSFMKAWPWIKPYFCNSWRRINLIRLGIGMTTIGSHIYAV
ncbi:hypothetical protein MES5069_40139 [Mesorhizobium escarrei]|uniref:Uncharacterized protein n=1 Tax=Mesorhizobium escarrei TaxID=666018 RepID=A0ABM9E458_9HYPH|nr:hypothetical protein MES5069_40139 [Mesorhizobium escarrei]